MYTFQQLRRPLKVKVSGTKCIPIVITQHSQIVFIIKHMIMHKCTI